MGAWIRRDGLLHIETCALIAVVSGIILPWWGAATTAMLSGIGKEIWDKYRGGVPSWHDVICDAIGVIIGTIITLWN